MQRMFPRALVACIREARLPHGHELAAMSEKVWDEALAPASIPRGRELAVIAARFALTGDLRPTV